jgi:pantoate--beta-alanine ligase
MVRDLNFPLRLVVAPTFREPDGLAMSSRNKYLAGDLRRQATVLWQAIQHAKNRVSGGRRVSTATLREQLRKMIESAPDAKLDYVEFFDPETLQPVRRAEPGVQMALAVFVGKTRLIDNAAL